MLINLDKLIRKTFFAESVNFKYMCTAVAKCNIPFRIIWLLLCYEYNVKLLEFVRKSYSNVLA